MNYDNKFPSKKIDLPLFIMIILKQIQRNLMIVFKLPIQKSFQIAQSLDKNIKNYNFNYHEYSSEQFGYGDKIDDLKFHDNHNDNKNILKLANTINRNLN